jgi:hypothetical protein
MTAITRCVRSSHCHPATATHRATPPPNAAATPSSTASNRARRPSLSATATTQPLPPDALLITTQNDRNDTLRATIPLPSNHCHSPPSATAKRSCHTLQHSQHPRQAAISFRHCHCHTHCCPMPHLSPLKMTAMTRRIQLSHCHQATATHRRVPPPNASATPSSTASTRARRPSLSSTATTQPLPPDALLITTQNDRNDTLHPAIPLPSNHCHSPRHTTAKRICHTLQHSQHPRQAAISFGHCHQ